MKELIGRDFSHLSIEDIQEKRRWALNALAEKWTEISREFESYYQLVRALGEYDQALASRESKQKVS